MANALRRLSRGTVYWVAATVLMVALMVGIFGLAEVAQRSFAVHLLLAPMFVLIGLALMVVGSRAPGPAVPARQVRRKIRVAVTPVSLLGLGLLAGGCLYGLTASVNAIVYSFAASVAVMVLVSVVGGHRRRS